MVQRRVVGALFMGKGRGGSVDSTGGELGSMGRIARFSSLSSLIVELGGGRR